MQCANGKALACHLIDLASNLLFPLTQILSKHKKVMKLLDIAMG